MEMFARARPATPVIRRAFFTLSLLALPLTALPQTKQADAQPKHMVEQTVFPKDTSQFLVRFNVKMAKKIYQNNAKKEGLKPAEIELAGGFQLSVPLGAKKALKIKEGIWLDSVAQDSLRSRAFYESVSHVFFYHEGGTLHVFEKR